MRRLDWILIGFLVLGVGLRCIGITAECFGRHFPRQHDTAAVAMNFLTDGLNPLVPRVDWRGDSNGAAEAEFPAYQALVAGVYRLVGPNEGTARAINVALFVASAMELATLVGRLEGARAGTLAAGFYALSPLAVVFNPTIQPDTLMNLSLLVAVERALAWSRSGGVWRVGLSIAALTLAALIKPLAVFCALPIAWLAFRRSGWSMIWKPSTWAFAVVPAAALAAWYWHGYQLWLEHGNTFGIFGVPTIGALWGPTDPRWPELARTLLERLVTELAPGPGIGLAVLGVFAAGRGAGRAQAWPVLAAWAVGLGAYVALVPWGHAEHDYYQLPFVFPLAWLMARAADRALATRWLHPAGVWACLLWMAVASGLMIREATRVPGFRMEQVASLRRAQTLIEPGALVVSVCPLLEGIRDVDYRHRFSAEPELRTLAWPMDLYYLQRDGWCLDANVAMPAENAAGLSAAELLDRMIARGARYLVSSHPGEIDKIAGLREHLVASHEPLAEEKWLAVWRLRPGGGSPR